MSSSSNIVTPQRERPHDQQNVASSQNNDTNNANECILSPAIDQWKVGRANSLMTQSIKDLKPKLVDVFEQRQSFHSKLLSPLRDLNEAEVHAVCDSILGLDAGSCSESDDVIHCILNYEVAVQFASEKPRIEETARRRTRQMKEDGDGSDSMLLECFYKTYMHSAVERAWSFVCHSFGLGRSTKISKKSGMLCMIGHRPQGKMHRPYEFVYQTFPALINRLKQVCIFLLGKTYGPNIVSMLLERKQESIRARAVRKLVGKRVDQANGQVRTNLGGTRVDTISINPSVTAVQSFLKDEQRGSDNVRMDSGSPLSDGNSDSVCGGGNGDVSREESDGSGDSSRANCETIRGGNEMAGDSGDVSRDDSSQDDSEKHDGSGDSSRANCETIRGGNEMAGDSGDVSRDDGSQDDSKKHERGHEGESEKGGQRMSRRLKKARQSKDSCGSSKIGGGQQLNDSSDKLDELLVEYCTNVGWDASDLLTFTDAAMGDGAATATTMKGLANTLKSACVDGDRVVMNLLDYNKMRNSPIVSAILLANYVKEVGYMPGVPGGEGSDGALWPLDVAAGITGKETCSQYGSGHVAELFIQQHPVDNDRFINVMGFSNYLSKQFLEAHVLDLDSAYFRILNDKGALLRVITSIPRTGLPFYEAGRGPGVTFGNKAPYTLHLSEIRREQVMTTENDLLRITEYVQTMFMKCINDVVERGLKIHLPLKETPTSLGTRSFVPANNHTARAKDSVDFPVKELPDPGDTIVNHGTRHNNPYDEHSDTQPMKPENWTEDRPEAAMQIFTHCHFASGGDIEIDDEDLRAVTIQHCVEGGACYAMGSFSSLGKFTKTNKRTHAIVLRGVCHGHLQMPGSQGDVKHKITAAKEGKNLPRFVESVRKIVDSMAHRDSKYKEADAQVNVCLADDHQLYSGVVQHLTSDGTPLRKGGSYLRTEKDAEPECKRKNHTNLKSMPRTTHQNGELWCEDRIHRDDIVDLPNNIKPSFLGRSSALAKQLLPYQATAFYKERVKESRSTSKWNTYIVGPLTKKDENGKVTLVIPGSECPDIARDYAFKQGQVKSITNDTNLVQLHLTWKNGWSVMQNLLRCKDGKGVLVPVEFRASGGAADKSGVRPMNLSDEGVSNRSATYRVSHSQKLTSPDCQKFDSWVENQALVHIFFQNTYLGPYTMVRSIKGAQNKPYVMAERERMERVLGELFDKHFRYCVKAGISKSLTDEDELYLMALESATATYIAEPLDPDILDKFNIQSHEVVSWSNLEVSSDDIVCHNKVHMPKDNRPERFGPARELSAWRDLVHPRRIRCKGWDNHLQVPSLLGETKLEELFQLTIGLSKDGDHMPFIRHVEKLRQLTASDELKILHDHVASQLMSKKINYYHLIEAAYYAAAKTRYAKRSVDEDDKSKLHPAREMVTVWNSSSRSGSNIGDQDEAQERIAFGNILEKSGLKLFTSKPTHPPIFHPLLDPSAGIAALATDSFRGDLGELECSPEHGYKWVHRNGPDYMLDANTADEAWKITFKATLVALISPEVVLELAREKLSLATSVQSWSYLLPDPNENKVNEYIETMKQYHWKKQWYHEQFDGTFQSLESFIEFLQRFVSCGKKIFQNAAQFSKSGKGRDEAVGEIKRSFYHHFSIDLKNLQLQIIMRNIELCLHEPFGRVDKVLQGHGSLEGAKCLIMHVYPKATAEDMPKMIVEKLNEDAKEANREKDNAFIQKLLVMGLVWDDSLECLVHNKGIRKKLDASDTEHMLCMFYTLLSHTLPSRNQSKGPPILDKQQYYPIFYAGACTAAKLEVLMPLMNDKLALEAYQAVEIEKHGVKIDGFHDLFSIDVGDPGKESDSISISL